MACDPNLFANQSEELADEINPAIKPHSLADFVYGTTNHR
jgi:hypothetical protein